MSLKLYLEEQNNMVKDIENEFSSLKIKWTEKEKKIVELIEKGKLIDEHSFLDRYGYKLYVSELSTGCKAALCVINNAKKIYNLIECGLNARDVIVSLCKEGNVFVDYNDVTFVKYGDDDKIDVQLDDYVFTDMNRLNVYIEDERPFEPDMRKGGIEHV